MRYIAPDRAELDVSVFKHPVFETLAPQHLVLCEQADWPEVSLLNSHWVAPKNNQGSAIQFVAQDSINDKLHYEQRIFDQAIVATRSNNWHDLFNAMIWMRYPNIKLALNARQVEDLNATGSKQRTRSQCAMTHFDEAGAIIRLSDAVMLAAWNEHDWVTFFTQWPRVMEEDGIQLWLFGHSIYEHGLNPGIALVAKALVLDTTDPISDTFIDQYIANRITNKQCLMDPQELRPIPLSGIPYWHTLYGQADFFQCVPCFQPKRAGKTYPKPLSVQY
jgi:hypothetical protein